MSTFCSLLIALLPALASEPVTTAWIRHSGAIVRGAPEVHSLEVREYEVVVRSAGVSVYYLGALQTVPPESSGIRDLEFRIPRFPAPATGQHSIVPAGVAGVFSNGVPIYNLLEGQSWNGSNLWHFDSVAATAGEYPQLLSELIAGNNGHSPILGFALDGYPIYGPWHDGRHMRSSYRLRTIAARTTWADGTSLTPAQYGPAISTEQPLGTFAEDYEYAAGTGDLDKFNGASVTTPEYPQGTYAYFLATDSAGRLSFPYLLGDRYYGTVPAHARPFALLDGKQRSAITAGIPVRLGLRFAARRLEVVHEKPVHLIVVSEDLAEFAHIHPERSVDDTFEVMHTFQHGGRYRLYADYTLPGSPGRIEQIDVVVDGPARTREQLKESVSKQATLTSSDCLRAGADLQFSFALQDRTDLQPFLGAWAHFVVIDESRQSFLHAHPMETAGVEHTHATGPAPEVVHTQMNFPHAGLYKIWAQFQQAGKVVTLPYILRVAEASPAPLSETTVKASYVVRVNAHGFTPARLELPAGKRVRIAFERDSEPNCGSKVVFPELSLTKDLPLGRTTVIEIETPANGELRFTCGMGMYRGVVVVK